jgi:NADPH2:quinone reductase
MRAIQFHEFGDPSKLQLVSIADPVPNDATAVIQIKAASVNPSDVKNVAGQMEHTVLPRVPGRDFSGVVKSGPREWIGSEVWGTSGDLGFLQDGTHAELISFPIDALVRKPKNLDHATASAIGVNFIIAWLGVMSYARLQPKETIAVVGAGGGGGGAVVQIAKAQGCRIIAIDRKVPDIKSPAGRLIDDYVAVETDVPVEMRRLTQGKGASVVFDAVGGVMFEPALLSLAHRGRLIEISGTGKRRVDFDLVDFYHNESRVFGADSRKLDAAASAEILKHLVPWFEEGTFSPPIIAAEYSLEEAQAGYRAVAQGTSGRVVIRPS